MLDVKACTVCLSYNVKLFNMDIGDLRAIFNFISGLQTNINDGLPRYLCVECCGFVKRSKTFRDKCQKAHFALLQVRDYKIQITLPSLKALDRKSIGIAPTLTKLEVDKINILDNHICDCGTNTLGANACYKENQLDENTNIKIEKKEHIHQEEKEPRVSVTIQEFIKEFDDDVDFDNGVQDDGDCFDNVDQVGLNSVTEIQLDADQIEDKIEEEFSKILPITMQEAKAAYEIQKLSRKVKEGDYECKICGKIYGNNRNNKKKLFLQHQRMHDVHLKGKFTCEMCKFYYRTQVLLDVHMNSNHNFKYVCTKCPDVNFDRATAKSHFHIKHIIKNSDTRSRLLNQGLKDTSPKVERTWRQKQKQRATINANKKSKPKDKDQVKRKLAMTKAPDILLVTPVKHEEQYQIVEDRKRTRNYIESPYKCEFCFRGFNNKLAYERHSVKHDPNKSGPMECDVCHYRFHKMRKLYNHMTHFHVKRYSCKLCNYLTYTPTQAVLHYKWHKKVTYKCKSCDEKFTKLSTLLGHVRLKHPSLHLCRLCGHSFVSKVGLRSHCLKWHSEEEVAQLSAVEVDRASTLYCTDCDVQFLNEEAFHTHFGSSLKHTKINESAIKFERNQWKSSDGNPYSVITCGLCGFTLRNVYQAYKHHKSEHPGVSNPHKKSMCEVCGQTCANLKLHLRTHTREQPFQCPYCDRRFSVEANRKRHILVLHKDQTKTKAPARRFHCDHCNRHYTAKAVLKLHIQTVHLKIPYAPWIRNSQKRKEKRKQFEMEMKMKVSEADI